MRTFGKITLSLCAMFVLAGCQDIKLKGLDACIKEVEISIRQGAHSQTINPDVIGGETERFDIDDSLDAKREIRAEMVVKSVFDRPECLEREDQLTSEDYRYSGTLPEIEEDLFEFDVNAEVTRTRSSTTTTGGTIHGGTVLPPPRNRGDDDKGIVMWADHMPGCRQVCWHQWARTNLFIDMGQGAGFQEIQNGQPWTDPAGHPQVYGQYGRDLPPGSNGDCFREDTIPGTQRSSRGIVDMPGLDVNNANAGALLQAGRAELNNAGVPFNQGDTFSIRYNFDMFSLLICLQPTPPQTIGRFHWTVEQVWEFTRIPASVDFNSHYNITSEPEWTDGNGGLPPNISAP